MTPTATPTLETPTRKPLVDYLPARKDGHPADQAEIARVLVRRFPGVFEDRPGAPGSGEVVAFRTINAILDVVMELLDEEGLVYLKGFGRFQVAQGRTTLSGFAKKAKGPVEVTPRRRVGFRTADRLMRVINPAPPARKGKAAKAKE